MYIISCTINENNTTMQTVYDLSPLTLKNYFDKLDIFDLVIYFFLSSKFEKLFWRVGMLFRRLLDFVGNSK